MDRSIRTVERDDWGVRGIKGKAVVSSRMLAEKFGKRHKDVLESIRNKILEAVKEFEENNNRTLLDFTERNFRPSEYKDKSGKKNLEYLITKDGFLFIAMGFTGAKSSMLKVEFIRRYNLMEDYILNRGEAKTDYKLLMNSLEENSRSKWAKPTEADMINKLVLGKRAKKFREDNNLPTKETRAYVTAEEIGCINKLQKMDYALVEMGLSYAERKEKLTKYFHDKLVSRLANDKSRISRISS